MAARGLVASVLQLLKEGISEEIRRRSLEDHLISELENDLKRMEDFLSVADSKEETHFQQLDVKKVRKLSHQIEDYLDHYACRCAYCRRNRACKLQKFFASIKNVVSCRHLIQSKLQIFMSKMTEISEICKRYTDSNPTVARDWHDCRLDLVREDELVGIDRPKRELKTLISNWESQIFKVICVVGMGGSGKTTLVKSLYNDANVKKMFSHHIWITVSESRKVEHVNELLQVIIKKLVIGQQQPPPHDLAAMNDIELKEMLYEFLQGKKYILVLDDIWTDAVWDSIKSAFPQNPFSRIVITTRTRDIAGVVSAFYYEMKKLDKDDSRTLFCNKAFQASVCPSELEEISKSILARCDGLPLGIALIGGVLSTKGHNIDEWDKFSRSLGAELVAGDCNTKLVNITKILSLSYYDLRSSPQKCYLYLSLFPEDYEIEKMRLIRLWVAEGFIEEKKGLTIEEVAEDYLNELIKRSLIQVASTTIDKRIATCRIHDHLRELLLSKSMEQNFVTVLSEQELQHYGRNSGNINEVRRLAIHNSINNEVIQQCDFSPLRSLQMIRHFDFPHVNSILSQSSGGFNLLKLLYLRGAQLDIIPDSVFNLPHLKYLNMRDTNVSTIPSSIGKLQELETLDLKNTMVTELPVQILRLKKLRHLIIYRYEILVDKFYVDTVGFKAPYTIGCLVNMQKLSCIEAGEFGGNKVVNEIGNLTQLRRLGITKLKNGDGVELCSSLERLSNLRSLSINSVDEMEAIDLSSLSNSFPKFLRNLSLRGHLFSIPPWISSLRFLVRLFLRRSRLSDNILPSLQDLPKLMELYLEEAYVGEELVFEAGSFKVLKKLAIESLEHLTLVNVMDGALPCLQQLLFRKCTLMTQLPVGIENLITLEDLGSHAMPIEFVRALQDSDNNWSLCHIGHIDIRDSDHSRQKF